MRRNGFKNILIVRLSAAGDVLHAMPAAAAIKKAFPDCRMSWAVEPLSAPLVRAFHAVDEVIALDRKALNREAKNPLKSLAAAKRIALFMRDLKKRRFDLAVDFQGNLRSATITFLSGAKVRLGFSPGAVREFLPFAYTRAVPAERGIHKIEKDFLLAEAVGAAGKPEPPGILFPLGEPELESFISSVFQSGPVAVLHPGVSRFGAFKAWPIEKYAALGDKLADGLGLKVVFTYGPGEEEGAAAAKEKMKHAAFLSVPTRTIADLGRILTKASLFIGADTGPLHLANAIGIPTVGIYGPKNPSVYGPYFEPKAVVCSAAPCAPCEKRKCDEAICMDGIGVEDVFAAAKTVFGRKKQALNRVPRI
jgi:lipopolysaccharide heptosyltransferase I